MASAPRPWVADSDDFDGVDLVGVDGLRRAELQREGAALGDRVDGDDVGTAGRAEQRGAQPDGPLPKHGEGVSAGDAEPPEGLVGGAGAAGTRRSLCIAEAVGHGDAHVVLDQLVFSHGAVGLGAVQRHAVGAELRPAGEAVLTAPAAAVVVDHDAVADANVARLRA